jgi:hypothetical protein
VKLDNINVDVDLMKHQIGIESGSFDVEYKSKRADLEREIHQVNSETRKIGKVLGGPSKVSSLSPKSTTMSQTKGYQSHNTLTQVSHNKQLSAISNISAKCFSQYLLPDKYRQ